MLLLTFAGLTALFLGIENLYEDSRVGVIWAKSAYILYEGMLLSWALFAVQFSGNGRWITPRKAIIPAVIPLMTAILVLTSESHHLLWSNTRIALTGDNPVARADFRVWFWIDVFSSQLLLLAGSVLILKMVVEYGQSYPSLSLLLIVGLLLPWAGRLTGLAGGRELSVFIGATATGFVLSGIVFGWQFLRFDMLDVMPFACDLVIESLPDGVMVIDRRQRIMSVNSTLGKILKQPRQQITGKQLETVFSQVADTLQSIDLQSEESNREVKINQTQFQMRISPLKDHTDNLRGRIIILHDITAHKQFEEELNQRVEKLNILRQVYKEMGSTLNTSQILMLALDTALRVSGAQGGYIALMDRDNTVRLEQVNGPYPPRYQHGYHFTSGQGIIGRVIASQKPELILNVADDPDYMMALPDTKSIMVLPLISQDKFGGILAVETPRPEFFDAEVFQFLQILVSRIAVAIDNARLHHHVQTQLEELQGLYTQVSQLETLKSDMIRIAAHDLANPLTSISGSLEFLDEAKNHLEPEYQEYFTIIQRNVQRMQRILQDILSLERIEKMADPTSGEVFDLCEQVDLAVLEYNSQAKRRSQSLRLDTGENTPVNIMGDPAQIHEAIANLIGNAIKYTPEGGRIDVRLRPEDGFALVEVQDTGYGIPLEKQERLFQPFYRVKSLETSKIEGTGLGLHLVKNIIERHQGKMIFNSVHGEGSTFGFKIPLCPAE